MSKLLVRPARQNPVHAITPQSAGWSYVGFSVINLQPGEKHASASGANELCLVLVSGRAKISVGDRDFGVIGERMNPFDGAPWSVYVPAHAAYAVKAEGPVELAICAAPGTGALPARVIAPAQVGMETRGTGTNVRHVRNILPETEPAESLLVVEVITPGGHWSSYPPHKHDRDALPDESALEETYYHRLNPPQGFGFQRVYTDDRTLDEAIVIQDRDVVLVPCGYHPVAAPHGYDLYYLNVMAGPRRVWKFHNDPAHEWLMAKK